MSYDLSMMIQSAGFVIVDFSGPEPTALCLMDGYHQWDFPKGHVERKESIYDAALRETAEECGLTSSDFKPSSIQVSTAQYKVPRGNKVTTYFFAEKISDTQVYLPNNPYLGHPEHVAFRWFPVRELHERMPKRLLPVVDKLVEWCDKPHEVQV